MTYDFELQCPRCGREDIVTRDRDKLLVPFACGNCLPQIIELKIVRVTVRANNDGATK